MWYSGNDESPNMRSAFVSWFGRRCAFDLSSFYIYIYKLWYRFEIAYFSTDIMNKNRYYIFYFPNSTLYSYFLTAFLDEVFTITSRLHRFKLCRTCLLNKISVSDPYERPVKDIEYDEWYGEYYSAALVDPLSDFLWCHRCEIVQLS